MSKGIFWYDNVLDDPGVEVTATYSTADGTHAACLLDRNPSNRWGPELYGGPFANWVDIDGRTLQSINGWGLVNHNYYAAGLDTAEIKGKVLPGGSFIPVASMGSLDDTYSHDPITADILGQPSTAYRYWQLFLWPSVYRNYCGGLYLARSVYELPETPDAPWTEEQHNQIARAETEGGHERRQCRGEPFFSRKLRWQSTTKAVADELRRMWVKQRGCSLPLLYFPHDVEEPSGFEEYYMPEYLRFASLSVRELKPGGRYSVVASFVGLVRKDH